MIVKNCRHFSIMSEDMGHAVKLSGERVRVGIRGNRRGSRSPDMGDDDLTFEIMGLDEPETGTIRRRYRLLDNAKILSFAEGYAPAIPMRPDPSAPFPEDLNDLGERRSSRPSQPNGSSKPLSRQK